MKKRLFTLLILLLAGPLLRAQFANFGDIPVEINADGETKFVGGVAVAENNVVIQYGSATIYCDYAEYNPETRDVLVKGNVRIYRDGFVFVGERAVYNLETKLLRAANFKGGIYPFQFSADSLASLGANAFQVKDATFTTSDSSQPDYHLRAKSARVYSKDHVVLSNVFLYVGQTPVFWWPYLYQSLNKEQGFRFTPGYYGNWGAFLLTEYDFPIGEKISGRLHFDLRANRGVGIGFDTKFDFGKDDRSWGNFRSYYVDDTHPEKNSTAYDRLPVKPGRYRVSLQSRIYVTDDIYANMHIDKWSDPYVTQDFMPGEFRTDPQPDNYISLTKWDENYTLTGIVRRQLNTFFETTERLPDAALDIKRQPLFGTPIFYQSETSAAELRRNFPPAGLMMDYRTLRIDSLQQIFYPRVYGGWFSFTPRLGVRGTYYNDTLNDLGSLAGPTFRALVTAGFDASFKFSREFENVESRTWGLHGLRHVVQPYTDFSFAHSNKNPENILQFDRYTQSTQLPVYDFPEFTAIDGLGSWTVWQFGVRNRLLTQRDDETISWFELDTFVDAYIDEPHFAGTNYRPGHVSNLNNKLRWTPLPWLALTVDSQLPLSSTGFTEVNTNLDFIVTRDLHIDLGHRYISNTAFYPESSLITFGGYYHINENWGVRVYEQYETTDSTLESQRYEIFRDLSSWIASIGFLVRDNRAGLAGNKGNNEYGVILTLTLKDAPQINLPFDFDPQVGAGKR